MQPKFSIIIPVYNMEPFLRECLDSVLASREHLAMSEGVSAEQVAEVICVDDGSSDGSVNILDSYGDRVQVVHQKNSGVSVARNVGLEKSVGEYVCFVDADDAVKEYWLSRYSAGIERSRADIIRMSDDLLPIAVLWDWLWNTFVEFGVPWQYAIKREVALMARFEPGVKYSEDALYAMSLVPHIRSAVKVMAGGYVYRVRSDSLSQQKFSSGERLAFVQALYRIGLRLPHPVHEVFSRACSIQILLWAMKPRDVEYRSEIANVYREMCRRRWPSIRALAPKRWIPYLTYRYLGILWPSMLTYWLVRVLSKIKKTIMCK